MKNNKLIIDLVNTFQGKKAKHNNYFELHISKKSRDDFNFNKKLFSINGTILFADYNAVLEFSELFNKRNPVKKIQPSYINAVGIIDELFHLVITYYSTELNPGVLNRAYDKLIANIGETDISILIREFLKEFPYTSLYNNEISYEDFLKELYSDKHKINDLIQEFILLNFSNINPGFNKIKNVFDYTELSKKTRFIKAINELHEFFKKEKFIGEENLSLIDFLMAPIINSPDDLEGQIKFIRDKWTEFIPETILEKLLISLDVLKDESIYYQKKDNTTGMHHEHDAKVPTYSLGIMDSSSEDSGISYLYPEYEKFSVDLDWMPKVVLLAKNIYVWLDQLSKKYSANISRLDQIPDAELELLKNRGFTGLWLIGIWERSSSSRKIKNFTGNPEAASSAYSLFDYEIAHNLGGEEAYNNLNYRTKVRGVHLACDMVPNHTGIFSKWIIEHPDYFINLDYPPYPNYSFTGPELSDNSDISIKIEDGYWSKKDAAVVFRHQDNRTGSIKYIYHGNDGTNMPWNDTAQLNFLKHEVREAVIQNIFQVARKFSIIRFDAAMTLTKKHFHRLWFPEPGTGNDIPSRSGYGLKKKVFDELFPDEFWREVVDRINKDLPNTLLLAEAFWLMEGYFVRTLGMHRVYNSAFMHMLKKEENSKYREAIKNTLEFNPEILKRYVNFLSNPDEDTAINQFGDGDKYFGVCMLMATLPGLPMFAHGQVEGYSEKYGMEYHRAYYNESVNENILRRHENEIFPILKMRYLFSQVEFFEFYDFITYDGFVNENVFAYTNSYGNQKAIVVFNNSFYETEGYIKTSLKKANSQLNDENKNYSIKNIGDALNVNGENDIFYLVKEHPTGMECLLNGREIFEHGIRFNLRGYQYKILLIESEIFDAHNGYKKLFNKLNGRFVFDIKNELMILNLEKVHNNFEILLSTLSTNVISERIFTNQDDSNIDSLSDDLSNKFNFFIQTINQSNALQIKLIGNNLTIRSKYLFLYSIIKLFNLYYLYNDNNNEIAKKINVLFTDTEINIPLGIFKLFTLLNFKEVNSTSDVITDLMLEIPLKKLFVENDFYETNTNILISYIKSEPINLFSGKKTLIKSFREGLNNPIVQEVLQLNEYNGKKYFVKEKYEQFLFDVFLYNLYFVLYNEINSDLKKSNNETITVNYKIIQGKVLLKLWRKQKSLIEGISLLNDFKVVAKMSGYNFEVFLKNLSNL